LLLGAVAGLSGWAVKSMIGQAAKSLKFAEIDGRERAAGMLVPPHLVNQPGGRIVGLVADALIGGMLGVASVYMHCVSGTDKATLKGAMAGQAMWTGLYGVLGTMGATKVSAVSPNTVLSELVGHTAYGAVTSSVIKALGDPGLFDGTMPLVAAQTRHPQAQTEQGGGAPAYKRPGMAAPPHETPPPPFAADERWPIWQS
jgi:hypothetical protein